MKSTSEHTRLHENLNILTQSLPAWLAGDEPARVSARQSYVFALRALHIANREVARILAPLQSLEAFASELLSQRLEVEWGLTGLDLRACEYIRNVYDYQPVFAGHRTWNVTLAARCSLLQGALQNFELEETNAERYAYGSGLFIEGEKLKLAPEAFALMCRDLDIGRRYQEHLKSIFTPASKPAAVQVFSRLTAARRCALRVAAHAGYLKKQVGWSAYQMLLQVCDGDEVALYEGEAVICTELSLFGQALTGLALFKQSQMLSPFRVPGGKQVLYVPGDPIAELQEYDDHAAMLDGLNGRLKVERFRELLVRHAPLAAQAALRHKLAHPLERGHLTTRVLVGNLFESMVTGRWDQLIGDCQILAVATADVDSAARDRLWAELEAVGVVLLNLAGLFVPLLNQLLLGAMAGQLASDVYEGVEDWTEGRTDEAKEILLNVDQNLGIAVGTGLIAHQVINWVKTSALFERLRPIQLFSGQKRLWNPDLAPYRRDLELAGSEPQVEGRIPVDGHDYVVIDKQPYRVFHDRTLGKWRIEHPTRAGAWSPVLEGNAEGAWRIQQENPWEWEQPRYLMRRLGRAASGLDDQQIDQILAVTGVSDEQLCRVHVDSLAAPASLRVAIDDFLQDAAIDGFITRLRDAGVITDEQSALFLLPRMAGWPETTDALLKIKQRAADVTLLQALEQALDVRQLTLLKGTHPTLADALASCAENQRVSLFEHCLGSKQSPMSVAGQVIQRDFPGLPGALVDELLAQCRDTSALRLEQGGRVPLALAEQARWKLRDYHLMTSLEGFYLPGRRTARFDKLVVGLLDHLPLRRTEFALQLRDQSVGGELLAVAGARDTTAVGTLIRTPQGYQVRPATGQAPSLHQDLFDALTHLLPADGLDQPGSAARLRTDLASLAFADRPRAAGLAGQAPAQAWFQRPSRLSDNRVGYPLSGRGAVGRHTPFMVEQCKALFPGMSTREIGRYLDGLSDVGIALQPFFEQKQIELQALRDSLEEWQERANNQPADVKARRRDVAQRLIAGWRRQSGRYFNQAGEFQGYRLDLQGADLSHAPVFPLEVDFSHIRHLSLADAQLSDIPNGFLDPFSKLQVLDLRDNSLTQLPAAIGDMVRLEALDLQGNGIVLNEAAVQALSGLRRLEELSLEGNPIGRLPNLVTLPGVRMLSLRNTGVTEVPTGLSGLEHVELVDLRDNRIEQLSAEAYSQNRQLARALMLDGNPLSEDTLGQVDDYRERTGINLGQLPLREAATGDPAVLWLMGDDSELAQAREAHWFALRAEPGSDAFFQLLDALSITADYDTDRRGLTERMWEVVDAAHANSQLRTELFDLAANPRSCGDSVSLNFSYLELQLKVFKANASGDASEVRNELLHLGRGLFRLEQLDIIAREDVSARPVVAGQPVDEIEVVLAYRVGLGERLELPGQPRSMLYRSVSGVTQAQLRAAESRVLAVEQPAPLAQFIASQGYWSKWLQANRAESFTRLRESFEADEDALEARKPQMEEQAYVDSYNRLHQTYQRQKQALKQRLTLAELERPEPAENA
ncbi:NEL-type E3 ubiquitin ligase domain-containing protein [Pseudomonas sp. R5(2019)]|uniref:NEL-type E3 ubiquitin ligase domain-containing protein n=1 Tax=Pseudomonas sp. R5(2019) TaxID=2697566 RepID=UPI001413126B|nr:NEL-type E3 ubiquitin ligase domain-containing protein [Pseudomonas sp. R5(2019)]NBA96824.1 hypothetical protein [Pseudomonas sp. R5(2019)]